MDPLAPSEPRVVTDSRTCYSPFHCLGLTCVGINTFSSLTSLEVMTMVVACGGSLLPCKPRSLMRKTFTCTEPVLDKEIASEAEFVLRMA